MSIGIFSLSPDSGGFKGGGRKGRNRRMRRGGGRRTGRWSHPSGGVDDGGGAGGGSRKASFATRFPLRRGLVIAMVVLASGILLSGLPVAGDGVLVGEGSPMIKDLETVEDVNPLTVQRGLRGGRSGDYHATMDGGATQEEDLDLESEEEDEHRFIVKYKTGARALRGRRKVQELGKLVMSLERDHVDVVILDSDEIVKAVEEDEFVEYVERDHKHYLLPTMSFFSGIMNAVESLLTPGIDMVKARDVDNSNVSNRKVCIVDSGYDLGHEDLQTTNISGYEGSLTAGPWNEDGDSHGTHVAGTIAAIGNNGKGVIGVVPNGDMNLFIVRVFGNNGWAWGSSIVAAVEACVDGGSDIVSMSLGRAGSPSTFEAQAYKSMVEDDDVLLIAAAGNGGNSGFSYPASYSSVMSVANVGFNKQRQESSQFNEQVDIAAPGVKVLSTIPNNKYGFKTGTSMATPHVTGVAALVWSNFPNLKGEQIRKAIEESAEDLGAAGYDHFYGHGLVNAKAAFDQINSGDIPPVCTDKIDGWRDGSNRDCAYYSGADRCSDLGGTSSGTGGFTANQACCACGGGDSGLNIPIGVKVSIRSVSSQNYLDGRDSNPSNNQVFLTNGDTKHKALQWVIEEVDGGYYALKSANSGFYVDGRNSDYRNSDGAVLMTNRNPQGDRYLQWEIEKVGEYLAFKSVSSGLYLNGRNPNHTGNQIWLTNRPLVRYMQWRVSTLEVTSKLWIDLEQKGQCVRANGKQVIMQDCNGVRAQKWHYDTLGRLVNQYTGLCLEFGNKNVLYAGAFQWGCNNGKHQQWDQLNNGKYRNKAFGDKFLGVSHCGRKNPKRVEARNYQTTGDCNCSQTWNRSTCN